MRRSVPCTLLVLLLASESFASWNEVAPGVAYRRFLSAGRDIHVARVALATTSVEVLATPAADRNTTVSEFAARRNAIVAVNADFFDPARVPSGLAIGPCGEWNDTRDNARQALVAFGNGRAEIYPGPEITPAEPWMRGAVGGFPELVRGCRVRKASELPGPARFTHGPHPRTAVGFSRDRKTMYLVVAEGRQAGVPGLTLPELASWMRTTLKVCGALNLDGGGSSAMWVGNRIVNRPSDGTERRVANHLAVVPKGAGAAACEEALASQPGPK